MQPAKPLTLIFGRTRSLGAVLIRAGAWWGPWSHCGVVGGAMVIESLAREGGVVYTPLGDVQARCSEHELVTVPCPDAAHGWRWAVSTAGARYDWGGVLSIPARERRWQSGTRWYCSEHCAQALAHAGLPLVHPGMHGVSPTQLYYLVHAAKSAAALNVDAGAGAPAWRFPLTQ